LQSKRDFGDIRYPAQSGPWQNMLGKSGKRFDFLPRGEIERGISAATFRFVD